MSVRWVTHPQFELTNALRRLVQDAALRARLATTRAPIRTVEEYTAEMEAIYESAVQSAASRRRDVAPRAAL